MEIKKLCKFFYIHFAGYLTDSEEGSNNQARQTFVNSFFEVITFVN
jgi:hypothetical protein